MKRFLIAPLVLAGCMDMETANGCPIYTSPVMQSYTQACEQAVMEEKARAAGGTVTKCVGGPDQMTCVTN